MLKNSYHPVRKGSGCGGSAGNSDPFFVSDHFFREVSTAFNHQTVRYTRFRTDAAQLVGIVGARITDNDQQIRVLQIHNGFLTHPCSIADFRCSGSIRESLHAGIDQFAGFQHTQGCLTCDQDVFKPGKGLDIFHAGDKMHARGDTDGSFSFRMVLLADIHHIAMRYMFTHQLMCLFNVRTCCIHNRQAFFPCFAEYFISGSVCSDDDNAAVDLIKQLQTCFGRIFQTDHSQGFKLPYNEFVVDDHAEHIYRYSRVFHDCLTGCTDCSDDTLTVSAGGYFDDFHVALPPNQKIKYNVYAYSIGDVMKRFEDFNLKENTLKLIEMNGFKEPTPIQEQVIPGVLKNKDLIGLSQTGTGKTHAYLIPVMEMLDPASDDTFAVITAPTRELAVQIYEKAAEMSEINPDIRVRLYVGGKDRARDIKQLQNSQPHIAVGTPGRIKDLFLEEGALRIDKAKMLIVDEADMTLEYGFLDDIDAFAGRMGDDLQMLAFSATMPDQLKPFLKKYMHHPLTVRVESGERFSPEITHILVPCYHHTYAETIQSILPGFQPYVCLIFANTREQASEIAEYLRGRNLSVTEIHGNLESRQRRKAMKELQSGRSIFVVATDLAARGIDIDMVTHVISCGFPNELEYYIHRAGRTGRAGTKGTCFALYHEEDDAAIRSLMKQGIRFEHRRCRAGKWQTLRPYGTKRKKPDDEMKVEIAKMMTKKNTKVKPGYKKKRAKAIEELHRKKKRDYIRAKIREEKKAMYKERQREKNRGES